MAALKFLNLFALSSLAILACSFNASPVNALTTDHHQIARSVNHAHNGVAKRRRDTSSKRCKPRPASSSLVSSASPETSTHAAAPSTTTHKATTSASPKPSATKSASPAPPPPSKGGSGKVGLSWSNNEQNSLSNFVTSSTKYVYNWGSTKATGADQLGLTFLAQLWGEKNIDAFKKTVVKGYTTHVLGFNEPDIPSQSNLDPSYAAQLWKQYIDPLKNEGYTLISPACTNAPAGITWMQNFLGACSGCQVDGIAGHYYGTDSGDFINHFQTLHSKFGKDLWITEFACQDYSGANKQCSKDQIFSFMGTVTSWMNSQDYVAAYFWFSAMKDFEMEANNVNPLNALIGDNNHPNDLGNFYLNP